MLYIYFSILKVNEKLCDKIPIGDIQFILENKKSKNFF